MTTTTCPRCGAPRESSGPHGMCPKCLMRMGLATYEVVVENRNTSGVSVEALGGDRLIPLGSVAGTATAAGTLGSGIARGGPYEEVAAQLGGSVAVLSSAAVGVPVSMTQAVSGGLVGTGLLRGLRQIRWRVAGQLAVAWMLTLPTAALAGVVIVRVWAMVT